MKTEAHRPAFSRKHLAAAKRAKVAAILAQNAARAQFGLGSVEFEAAQDEAEKRCADVRFISACILGWSLDERCLNALWAKKIVNGHPVPMMDWTPPTGLDKDSLRVFYFPHRQ